MADVDNAVKPPALEVDEDNDSTLEDDSASETTSVASSLIRGHMENGRRYSTLREGYWGPSDEAQYETMDRAHYVYLILRCDKNNLLFQAPLENPRRILDLGTGTGAWAMDTADKFPDAIVHGVDLFPPPKNWLPPNCYLEVEDITQQWTYKHRFDLIHVRFLVGAFTDEEWTALYQRAYDNLEPGGWIEQVEPDARILSDDGTLDPNSELANWGELIIACGERAGRSITTIDTFRRKIEGAGFINVQEEYFKVPIGSWAKNEKLKEAGRVNWEMWNGGLEGFALFLLTNFGAPRPWTKDEIFAMVAKVREEIKKRGVHTYHFARRVWAQKPAEDHPAAVA